MGFFQLSIIKKKDKLWVLMEYLMTNCQKCVFIERQTKVYINYHRMFSYTSVPDAEARSVVC